MNIRKIVLIELFVIYTVLMLIDYLFFQSSRFSEINPHPFWVPVLLIASQYGIREGVISAAMATALFLVGNVPPQSLMEDSYSYVFSMSLLPILWLLAALSLGAIQTRQTHGRNAALLEIEELKLQNQKIHTAYAQLENNKKVLDFRIASQLNTSSMAFHAARKIQKMDEETVLHGVSELVSDILSPDKFSIFLLNDSMLSKVIDHGWTDNDQYSEYYAASENLFQQVVARRKVLCVSHPRDETLLTDQGVLAGPLFSSDTHQIVGMLKIEKIAFANFNVNTVESFRTLCEWIGTLLADMDYQLNLPKKIASNPGLRTLDELNFQSQFLFQLSQRIDFEVSVVIIKLQHNNLSPEKISEITLAMSRALIELRGTDHAFSYGNDQDHYILLLPQTPLKHAGLVAQKFEPKFRRLLPDPLKNVPFSATTKRLADHMGGHAAMGQVSAGQ